MTKNKVISKVIYIVIIFLCVFLFGLSYLNFSTSKRNAVESIQKECVIMLEGIIRSVDNFLCERKCDIDDLAMLVGKGRTLSYEYMTKSYEKNSRYESIEYVDVNGNYIYKVSGSQSNFKNIFDEYKDESLTRAFNEAKESQTTQISDFYLVKDKQVIISIISPVFIDDQIIGFVIGNIKNEAIGEEAVYSSIKNTGKTVFGVSESGIRVFSLYKGFIGDNVFDKSNKALNEKVKDNYIRMTKGEVFAGEHYNTISSKDYNVTLDKPEKRYIVSKPLIIDNDFKVSIAIVSPKSIAQFVDWFAVRQIAIFVLLNIGFVFIGYIIYKNNREKALLQQSLNKSQETERIKTEFFCNMSHELRTPLTIILTSLHFVSRKYETALQSNEELGKIYTKVRQNCFRLLKIINNLLEISRIDAGTINQDVKNVDVIKLVEDIVMSSVYFGRQKNIEIIFDTEFEEKVIALDIDSIERVVLNLLSNAIKFTPKDGEILVNITGDEEFINISVKDNGIGIPQEKKDLIFERFIQINNPLRKYAEGTGIGLSLVKSIIEMHNGKIEVISEEGKGSEFIVSLPNVTVELQNVHEVKKLDEDIINKVNIEFSDI